MEDPINYNDTNKKGINIYKSDPKEIRMIKARVSDDFLMSGKLDFNYFEQNIPKIDITDQQISHLLSHRIDTANDIE